ncbi:MAG: ABC transporter permease [Candidatus Eisenbacteria bacterium]|nr:ABC transporter permease [Candidatus Eisenbacteria bacterium]
MLPRILIASLAARRGRVLLALLAVSLGVAVATALATLSLEVGDDLARTLRAAGPNFVVQPSGATLPLDVGGAEFRPARAGANLDLASVAALKQSFCKNNLLAAAPEIDAAATIAGRPATVVGTWFDHPLAAAGGTWRTGIAALRPTWTIDGHWPHDSNGSLTSYEIAIGRDLARRLDLAPGRNVEIAIGGTTRRFLVTAVVDAGGRDDARAFAPLETVAAMSDRPNTADRVWVSALVKPGPQGPAPDAARDPAGYERYMCTPYPANVAHDLARNLPGAEVLPLAEVVAGEGRVVGRLNLLLLLLALAALAAATLGLVSTTTATVMERRVEIGLLRSLGASSRQLAALLMTETALISCAGGALGWLVGGASAALVRGSTFGAGAAFEQLLLPVAIGLALGVAFLGTIGPLRLALRLDPATVLRGQP